MALDDDDHEWRLCGCGCDVAVAFLPTRPAVTVKGRRGSVKDKKGDGRAGSVGIAIVVDDPNYAAVRPRSAAKRQAVMSRLSPSPNVGSVGDGVERR